MTTTQEIGVGGRDWAAELHDVLARPERLRAHFQPIVDLERGRVCGYETLARFDGADDGDGPVVPGAGPAWWFAAARQHGLAGRLEALMVTATLDARARLAPGCFLTVNVSPAGLLSDEVRDAFAAADRLEPLIVEVTEQSDADLPALRAVLDGLRERGAQVAVDDAGSGYASLGRITALRPQYVKVDRALVADLDADAAKAAVVEALCELAERIGAWVVAEGVERPEELDALIRLRVPLGQGYAFGRPGARLDSELDVALADLIRERGDAATAASGIAPLLDPVPTVPSGSSADAFARAFATTRASDVVVVVDGGGRPSGLLNRADHECGREPARSMLLVRATMRAASVARRAMARPTARRFDPVVCVDELGRLAGVVRLERVVEVLARTGEA